MDNDSTGDPEIDAALRRLDAETRQLLRGGWLNAKIGVLRHRVNGVTRAQVEDALLEGFAAVTKAVRNGTPVPDIAAYVYKTAFYQLFKLRRAAQIETVSEDPSGVRGARRLRSDDDDEEPARRQALVELQEIVDAWSPSGKRTLMRIMMHEALERSTMPDNVELAELLQSAGYPNATRQHVATWKGRIRQALEREMAERGIEIGDLGLPEPDDDEYDYEDEELDNDDH